jgi:hypothetical protein
MNRFDRDWQKLVALARQAPRDPDEPVPPAGFATRVVARAAQPAAWSGLERFAWRGFLAAATCCLVVLAYSYFGQPGEFTEDGAIDDTVSELLALY